MRYKDDLTTVICPFYGGTDKKYISCEGFLPGTKLKTEFRRNDKKEIYMEGHCKTFSYQRCAMYKFIEQKYEEQ